MPIAHAAQFNKLYPKCSASQPAKLLNPNTFDVDRSTVLNRLGSGFDDAQLS